jgi:3-methyladenine DNA glycosylase AlkD
MLKHSHDLMHKATGWMLREAWKRDAKTIEQFLNKFAHQMPRTMLRYAIERIPEPKRKAYLSIKFQSH